jgi:hypothetical protein
MVRVATDMAIALKQGNFKFPRRCHGKNMARHFCMVIAWQNRNLYVAERGNFIIREKIKISNFLWHFHGKAKICTWLNMATWPKNSSFVFANSFHVATQPAFSEREPRVLHVMPIG